ncbi:putative Ig domain-containing protein [Sulfurimonas sp.]|uniref:putative Ig domain-containing protein n=1 Tax=Sulfurimonas sp. TaxID=2022749 RepID=UPI00356AC18E
MKFFYYLFFILSFFILPVPLNAGDKTVSINDVNISEGNSGTTTFTFTITGTDNTPSDESIDYIIYDATATTADSDYIAATGTTNFDASTDTATISVTVNGDTTPEADETFIVIIYNLRKNDGSASLNSIADDSGIGTILNDDTQAWPPIMGSISDQFAIKDLVYSLNIADYVTEVNDDNVTYSISGSIPAGLSFNTSSGVLSGTPTTLGVYDLNVTASDTDGSSAAGSFSLTVDYGFCYEYAYSQQGSYFTENNDGNESADLVSGAKYIVANDTSIPVDMNLYIRYRSSLNITDLNMSVLDINSTQVTYHRESTEVAKNGIIYTSIADSSMDVADEYIKKIPLGTLSSSDYFYVNYKLDPKISILNTPINADLSLSVNGTTNYTLTLGDNVPLCSANSGGGYHPISAIFNMVHADYYDFDIGGSNRYYNLPTQVVKREGNFKIISLEPAPDEHTLKSITAVPVSVELIDVDVGHGDIESACGNTLSAITPRVWVVFDNNTTTMPFNKAAIQAAIDADMISTDRGIITTPSDFYKEARENVAFRTSYYFAGNDDELLTLSVAGTPGNPEYNVDNFSDAVKIGKCVTDVDGNLNNQDTVAQFCDNAGSPSTMTPSELRTCLECVYGLATTLTCSRDNFAIRPEAFDIQIDDQDQANPASQTPLSSPAKLAAGYNYNLELTATSHIDDNASLGYTRIYTETTPYKAQYQWNSALTGCNDEGNKTVGFSFVDGSVDANTSVDQVGEYLLNVTDSTWTSVDSTSYQTGTYFMGTPDCVADSTVTQAVGYSPGSASAFIGCNISSSHTNPTTSVAFNDFDTSFYPYKFDLSDINSSVGLNNTALSTNSFVYMSDMSQDEYMSFHLNGNIRASGYNDSNLTNFTTGCYAQAIDINISKSNLATTGIAYQYRFNTLDSNNLKVSTTSGDLNNTAGPISLSDGNFTASTLGSINSKLNLNFNRKINTPANPEKINFITYNVDCQNANINCSFSADLTTKTTQGVRSLDNNVTHYYGRTHAPRQRYEGPTGTAKIYFEAYCFNALNSVTCDKTLLQDGTASTRTNDIRWYVNTQHITTRDGNIGTVIQKGGTGAASDVVDAVTTGTTNPSTAALTYDESFGYPYKTTMDNNASRWLIYNEDNPTAIRNEFPVEFDKIGSDWSGAHDTNTTTRDAPTIKTNRRSMW